jgi:redox-sensitive bicupin YhaK (pirin superfamily)
MTLEHLSPHSKAIGDGLVVRRCLPNLPRQAVGPFVFFDHFGPVELAADANTDVRPHPHIGLATVTYLFEGAMQHHDSLGCAQRIEPGAVNWMSAGRGIVHSERRPADLIGRAHRLHGLQLWVALPAADEAMDPAFAHTPADAIPQAAIGGATVRVLVGQAHGLNSPVATRSPTLFIDHALAAGAAVTLPVAQPDCELAVYAVDQAAELIATDGRREPLAPHVLTVLPELPAGEAWRLQAGADAARVVLVGGTPLGHRQIWWNFVATSREAIVAAADAWERDAFGQVPGETERIPLPDKRPR